MHVHKLIMSSHNKITTRITCCGSKHSFYTWNGFIPCHRKTWNYLCICHYQLSTSRASYMENRFVTSADNFYFAVCVWAETNGIFFVHSHSIPSKDFPLDDVGSIWMWSHVFMTAQGWALNIFMNVEKGIYGGIYQFSLFTWFRSSFTALKVFFFALAQSQLLSTLLPMMLISWWGKFDFYVCEKFGVCELVFQIRGLLLRTFFYCLGL